MSTDEAKTSAGRSRATRLLMAGLAVAVVAGAGVWWSLRDQSEPGTKLPAGEQARLATAVAPILEAGLPDARYSRLACAVKILGTEPADAANTQVVTTAYVWSLCRSLGQPVISESGLPAVVHLGTPTRVEAPDQPTLSSDIGMLFPKRLQDAARDDGSYADELNAAVEERARQLS
ncbi:hypothetical protein [Actinoplanes regularis]|uniref:hypothetical protein n=1 Tax=Actinoplanes regularis TaxID=52697 RepID=UPI001178B11B|nr:hypothetical protein [Actinoplanes regularis]